jgi:hypothetical protein
VDLLVDLQGIANRMIEKLSVSSPQNVTVRILIAGCRPSA